MPSLAAAIPTGSPAQGLISFGMADEIPFGDRSGMPEGSTEPLLTDRISDFADLLVPADPGLVPVAPVNPIRMEMEVPSGPAEVGTSALPSGVTTEMTLDTMLSDADFAALLAGTTIGATESPGVTMGKAQSTAQTAMLMQASADIVPVATVPVDHGQERKAVPPTALRIHQGTETKPDMPGSTVTAPGAEAAEPGDQRSAPHPVTDFRLAGRGPESTLAPGSLPTEPSVDQGGGDRTVPDRVALERPAPTRSAPEQVSATSDRPSPGSAVQQVTPPQPTVPMDQPMLTAPPAPVPSPDAGSAIAAPETFVARHAAQQMAVAVSRTQDGTTEIRLDPEELGRVRLSLQTGDATILVVIQAERPETADLMRRHLDQLAQEFRGLGYDDVSFSFGSGHADPDAKRPFAASAGTDRDSPDTRIPDAATLPRPLTGRGAAAGHLDIRL